MASNVQAGTRGLSAGDWIRLKRLHASRFYWISQVPSPDPKLYVLNTNKDIINPNPSLSTESGRRVYTNFGTSKIRRPASFWTDFRASQASDYVLETQDSETKSRSLTAYRVCDNCGGVPSSDAVKHNGPCMTCIHNKVTNIKPIAQQPS